MTMNARDIISEDLKGLKIELDQAYNEFNNVPSDAHKLIDSCIYRINYIQSRIDHLLDMAKKPVPVII